MTDPYQPPQPYSNSGSSGTPAGEPRPGTPQPPPGYSQQPGTPPPGYQAAGYPPPYAPDPPGKTMGIIGFVLAFVLAPAGIIVSAMALSESKKVGYDNVLGKWGFWLSIVFTGIGVLIVLAYVLFFVLFIGAMGAAAGAY
ncbi:hypothetical protein [Isoptericola croceus]|uniref:hypothetical protein n=1 Tax=Isoptericola croceus TaxID=3031406 RepID=UPI0023F79D62|nr:hypothetical protein [Isoptericola croceus]